MLCAAYRAVLFEQGPYDRRLASLCPSGWRALARYPPLCKHLNFRQLVGLGASRVLLCDCDTVFLADVARLLERYSGVHLAAREEVHTSRSLYGADHRFIDESLLRGLAAADGARPVPPFNTGVVLVAHEVVQWLAALEALAVDYAWRFLLWMALHPVSGEEAMYGELEAAEETRSFAGAADLARALPYPSANRWILEEVALWLVLGHVPGLRTMDFDRADVVQNGEFAGTSPDRAGWIVCHYYSQNLARIAAWLRGQERALPA
jgi:hypothetical protein